MEDEVKLDAVDSAQEVVVDSKSVTSLETALQEIARLKVISDDAIKTRDSVKRKLKEFESNFNTEKEARVGLESKFRDMTINGALKAALTEAGSVAVDTAFKLVDKSAIKLTDSGELDVESLKSAVEAVKAEHLVLFTQPVAAKVTPPVARASEAPDAMTAYALELKKAKSQKEVMAVMEKYQKVKVK